MQCKLGTNKSANQVPIECKSGTDTGTYNKYNKETLNLNQSHFCAEMTKIRRSLGMPSLIVELRGGNVKKRKHERCVNFYTPPIR